MFENQPKMSHFPAQNNVDNIFEKIELYSSNNNDSTLYSVNAVFPTLLFAFKSMFLSVFLR